MFEDIWETVKAWANHNAQQYILAQIPRERTDLTGDDAPLVPLRDYLRLWLDDMFLAQDRKWFVDQFPAVHTTIELKFGPSPIKISHVTDGTDQVGRGVFRSFALTDLVPFGGGIVRIQSALLSLEGTNYIKQGIGILRDFSSLVVAPLGQTLTIAEKVGTGMQNLLRGASGAMVLGFHREYAADGGGGGSVLNPGYTALILGTQAQIDQNRLSVKNSQLLYAGQDGTAKPLDGYNYMLLRVERARQLAPA
jgi:hypothetical protein